MHFKRTLKPRLYTVVLGVLLLISALLLLSTLIQSHAVQSYLLKRLISPRGLELEFSRTSVDLWTPLRVEVYNLALRRKGSTRAFLSVRGVEFTIPWSRILKMDFLPQELVLKHPRFKLNELRQDIKLKSNKAFVFRAFMTTFLGAAPLIRIVDGKIKGAWGTVSLERLNLYSFIKGSGRGVLGSGVVKVREAAVPFRIQGNVALELETGSDQVAIFDLTTKSVAIGRLPSFHGLFFEKGEGALKLNLSVQKEGRIVFSGRLKAKDPCFSLVQDQRKKSWSFPFLELFTQGEIQLGSVELSSLSLKGPGFQIKGTMGISLEDGKEAQELSLLISAPTMHMEIFKQIFPAPLVSTWVEEELFPTLSGGTVDINTFSLQRDTSRSVSVRMKLSWEDLRVSENLVGLPLSHVSGDFHLGGGRIRISHMAGKMGDSKFEDVSLDIADLSDPNTKVAIKGRGLFHLPNLLGLSRRVIGSFPHRNYFKEVESVSGVVASSFEGILLNKGRIFRLLSASLEFKDCELKWHSHNTIQIPSAKLEIAKMGYLRFRGKASWGESLANFLGFGLTNLNELGMRVDGDVDLGEVLETFFPNMAFHLKVQDTIPFTLSFSRYYGKWGAELKLDLAKVKVDSRAVKLGFRGKASKAYIKMGNWEGKAFGKYGILLVSDRSSLEMILEGSGQRGWDVELSTPAFYLEHLLLSMNGYKYTLGGKLDFDLQIRIPTRGLSKIGLRGKMRGASISLKNGGAQPPIELEQFEAKFSGKKLTISNALLKLGKLVGEVEARLKGWGEISGEMRLLIKTLDVGAMVSDVSRLFKTTSRSDLLSRLAMNSNVRVHVEVGSGRYRKLRFGPARGKAVIYRGGLFLEGFDIELPHGRLALKGHLKRGKAEGVFLIGEMRLKDQPVKEIFQGLRVSDPILEGRLTLEAVFYSQAEKIAKVLKGLKGRANFLLNQGKILKSNVMIKVLDFLSVQKIFIEEPPDLSKEGFYYKTIGGSVDIEGGVIKSDSIVMKSPIFNAIGRGQWDLSTMEIKGELGVQPFVAVDAVIKRVPVVGYILTGKDESILVYHFHVKGSFNDPDVSYVPLKHMGKSIAFFLGRVVYTPIRLFKNLYDFLKGLKDPGITVPRALPSQ